MAKFESLINDYELREMSNEALAQKAVELAELMLKQASKEQKLNERYHAWKMSRLMEDSVGKAFTLAMADQVFRPMTHTRSADQFRYLVKEYGVPNYLPVHERVAMQLGAMASAIAPEIVMSAVTQKMRGESDHVILPSEGSLLKPYLAKRKRQGTRVNINQLGEAILGEAEAEHRMQQVIDRLESPDCEYVSVKVSAIFSQINLEAYKQTLELIKQRIRRLYRCARENSYVTQAGKSYPKFVNLDMEEYRDLRLTCDAFMQVLDEEEFLEHSAGIVLQAYLPDSYQHQIELTEWAHDRVSRGGAPIKIRIVKGANLAMEKVEASLHGWPQAPYVSKVEVDANFKRMVLYGCIPAHAQHVRLGIASHNLFEISYALLVRAREGVEEFVEFEMLEGMANHQARAVQEIAGGLLRYAPVVREEDFHTAISYLVRRLDENTHEANFLHGLFGMKPGSPNWNMQKKMFFDACEIIDSVKDSPNRVQDRASEKVNYAIRFHNAADTDWSLRKNVDWITQKIAQEKSQKIDPIPLQIGGELMVTENLGQGVDPSKNAAIYQYSLADLENVQRALDVAEGAQPAWAARTIEERARVLKYVAVEIERKRGESIAVMVREAGKAVVEADAEVSEAIDFANYYAESLSWEGMFDGVECAALGTVVIAPPWNFPYAIPCGGALAALMAGNTVIMKPAPESVYTAWVMTQQLWCAGVPREALQFVPCPDDEIGRSLVASERVNAVVLTGAFETGKMFQSWKPDMRLFAETSGKNSMIITSAADPDQAIKDLVKGSFGHAGQKCSASSLAILEADIYDDPAFMRQLKDAVESLAVGQSWDLSSVVTPLMLEPERNLERAFTTLDDGEEWLLKPKMLEENPRLWSPGVKLGVKQGSWYHNEECFGPILGLIRANNLEEAMQIQNDSDFGLTGGIHTLDDREIAVWREQVEVGNAYINRPITGAIVRRQPFGGWKKSSFGPGAKAGGPNYVSIFASWEQVDQPTDRAVPRAEVSELLETLKKKCGDEAKLEAAVESQAYWMVKEFGVEHDPSELQGETNHFRYVPLKKLLVRVAGMTVSDMAIVLLAAKTACVEVEISSDRELELTGYQVEVESELKLSNRLLMAADIYSSIRAIQASETLRRTANEVAIQLTDYSILCNGRLELLHYFREQSISECTHRYGNTISKPHTF